MPAGAWPDGRDRQRPPGQAWTGRRGHPGPERPHRAVVTGASVPETGELDLASLESVHRFAGTFGERHEKLDILVNNAGIAGGPRRITRTGSRPIPALTISGTSR